MGTKRRFNGFPWLEAGNRLSAISLGGLQRSDDPVCAWPGIADPSLVGEKLSSLELDLSLEEAVWARVSLRRAAFHASALAHLGGLPWHPGCLHEGSGD